MLREGDKFYVKTMKFMTLFLFAGERLIQYASENLVTEVLIHPQTNTFIQCMRNLLSSFTRHRHIIHAGYTFTGNGSWILQVNMAMNYCVFASKNFSSSLSFYPGWNIFRSRFLRRVPAKWGSACLASLHGYHFNWHPLRSSRSLVIIAR